MSYHTQPTFSYFFIFSEAGSCSVTHVGIAVVQSWLIAASASWAQAILHLRVFFFFFFFFVETRIHYVAQAGLEQLGSSILPTSASQSVGITGVSHSSWPFLHFQGLNMYLNAIQTMCPHILRYLTTAVITNKDVRKRRQVLKDLVKVIQQESYTYKDPITEFVECLYVNFDFDGAQKKLRECESVLVNDFFLVACLEDFIENARLFIFETFCRIHQCISIKHSPTLLPRLEYSGANSASWVQEILMPQPPKKLGL
ncbi:Eukaryotic translation initiation factor 3 subunit E-A [Plecturocebus cupreus]